MVEQMNRAKLTALLMLIATIAMAQTTKKSFTLHDLLGGGSTFWNLQPQYLFSTWWGEIPVELRDFIFNQTIIVVKQGIL